MRQFMTRFLRPAFAGFFIALIATSALAQSPQLGAGQVMGNSTAAQRPARAETLTAMFDRAFCATANSALARISGSWACLASANNSVWATNGSGVPALTTTLPNAVQDNITRLGTIANIGAALGATFGGTGQSSYAVGDILYAPTTTTVGKLADVATGSAIISGGVGVIPSYGKIGLTTHVSGTLPFGNGGTGISTATSGGIPYFNSTTSIASSGLLTLNALLLGGGAGGSPVPMGSLGTTTTLLHGNAAGAPTFGAVALTTDVTGVLPVANGGTNASSASGTAVDNISGFASTGIMSRTGAGTYSFSTFSALADVVGSTRGSILYRGAGGWAIAAPTTAGQVWTSNGAGADPTYQAVTGTGTVTNVNCAGTAITTTGNCIGTLVNVQFFTTGGTYTRGANVTHALGACHGSGGGGGGCANASASQTCVAGAGGSGGFAMDYIAPSATETITIPAGGNGAVAGANAGTAGAAASIGTKVVATGGSGGAAGSSAAVVTMSGALGGAVAGMTGSIKTAGNPGQAGFGSFSLGFNVAGNGGSGVGWFGGGGGQSNVAGTGTGIAGVGFGGGGSGGTSYNGGGATAGGNGFAAACMIMEFM